MNSDRYVATLSQFSAWTLLRGIESEVDQLSNHPDADDQEYMNLVRNTLETELRHLESWFSQNCGYEGWEESFQSIKAKLDS